MKKVSIITLTHNNLEKTTKLYINSLYKYTNQDLFELIIVENGSTDGTVEYIEKIKSKYSNIKVILNSENKGFSKGNNQGLKIATGDYICLINNDILFTPDWLDSIVKLIENNSEVGLISPIINEFDNANININNYLEKSKSIIEKNKADIEYKYTCFFCCACMKREVFEKVGFLDENFTPAWFEDDDYCIRTLYAGYKNAIAPKVFVFHNHCQTSSKLTNAQEIFNRNKDYYYKKHFIAQYISEIETENEKLKNKSFAKKIKKIARRIFF